ncbi:hypothetical protein [Streptomyces syringium]|uniref:hypothetical protein n=1 Tax=Streptomyces syringium TaxID=76729 RepID=UPI00339E184F
MTQGSAAYTDIPVAELTLYASVLIGIGPYEGAIRKITLTISFAGTGAGSNPRGYLRPG